MNTKNKTTRKFNIKKSISRVSNNVLNNMVFASLVGIVIS